MDIFKRQFVPTAMRPVASALSGCLLLTDSEALAAWAARAGVETCRVDARTLADDTLRCEAIERIGWPNVSCLLYGIGFDAGTGDPEIAGLVRSAQGMLVLAKALLKRSAALDIVAIRDADAVAGTMFDGIALTACQESARLTYVALTLDAAPDDGLASAIAACRAGSHRRYRIHAGRLEQEAVVQFTAGVGSERLRAGGCHVVIGGAGGVGRLLSRWLLDRFGANVCVIGRSPINPALRERLKHSGVRAYAQADAADPDALAAAMGSFAERFGRIDGVFHLAGLLRDSMIANKPASDIDAVLPPKVGVALSLMRLPDELQPNFVCAFTSLSGLVGNFGQSDYAAANTFVDALVETSARATPSRRTAWFAINWGLWDSEGMRIDAAQSDLRAMPPDHAFAAIERILAGDDRLTVAFTGDHRVLGGLVAQAALSSPVEHASLDIEAQVAAWIRELVYRFTRMQDIAVDASLIELGIDSAALISLVSAMERRLSDVSQGLRLSKAMVFDHPSVAALTRHLCATHRDAIAEVFRGAPVGAEPAAAGSGVLPVKPSAHDAGDALLQTTLVWLHDLLRRFTGLTDIDDTSDLLQAGVDSVASIHLAGEIERRLSSTQPVRIRKTLVFDQPSLRAIADTLLAQHADALAAALVGPAVVESFAADPLAPAIAAAVPAERPPAFGVATATATTSPRPYRDGDIAIVGMAGEFPGADDIDALWELLEAGLDAVTAVPPERWDWRDDYTTDARHAGSSYGRHGGFLRRAKQFDPVFFGIAPVEASRIDPQERRLLQVAYHALEDAGHFAAPEPETGVFTAAMFGHYQNLDDPSGPISASFSSIANRMSFTFDFRGPSLCVDTMCSGSLTALHLAINSLRAGECRSALVGAVNVMPHPGKLRLLSEGRFLSPTGRCHSFGIEADGYVPGEGAIALLLKPLPDAITAGDRIHGVIRGSALNAGGRVSGFTVPSARAQESVVRKALAQAAVDPAQVDYIEAHGTGTSLGDPIEIAALDAAYGTHVDGCRRIGSIKSNLGHLESAAGLAGLIKVLLQFRHRRLAPTLNCTLVNPYLQLETTAFALSREIAPWKPHGRPRIAGLSAFGAGGSNAHVILEEPPHTPALMSPARDHYLFALSARNARALRARIEALVAWLERHPDADPYAVACTLALHREHLRERVCFVAANIAGCMHHLNDWLVTGSATKDAASPMAEADIVAAYLEGRTVHWKTYFPVRSVLSLPHYPFDPTEYWSDTIAARSRDAIAETSRSLVAAEVDDEDRRLIVLEPCWSPASARPAATLEGATPRYIVVCDAQIADSLHGRPDMSVIIPGDRTDRDRMRCTVRIDHQQDLVAAIRDCASDRPAWLIVCARALQYATQEETVARAHFALAQAALEAGNVTRIAYVYGDRERPVDHAASAFYRVLGMEEANVRVALVELDMDAFETPASLLDTAIAELASAQAYAPPIRITDAGRQLAGLRRATLARNAASRFRNGGVYLITGGLGMIGQGVAEELLRRFAAKIVLVGRSPENVQTGAKLARLRALGGSVEYLQADVGDAAAVRGVVDTIRHRHGALHGVVHSAGVLRDGLLRSKSRQDFEDVVRAKMVAARLLDNATQGITLDFFVLFSSMSGLFGNVGQADYALANAWLDAFAVDRYREVAAGRRSGLTLSIDWPLWYDDRDDGADRMSDYRSLGGYLRDNFGIAPLPLSEGSRLLIRLIDGAAADATQLAPFVGDVDRILTSVRARSLQAVVADCLPGISTAGAMSPGKMLPSASITAVAAAVAAEVGRRTGLAEEDIDRHASYGDLGLSSVMLQELARDIESRFDIAIPPSALFTYNSIVQLAEYLVSLGAALPQGPAAASGTPVGAGDGFKAGRHEAMAPTAATMVRDGRIAIIGLDGQLPGGRDLAGFWQGLIDNRSAIARVERWPDLVSHAGTITEIDHFDAKFFGISAREAMLMDPQHRLFLQCSYNAMLDAGYSPRELSSVGVFAGVQFSDYQTLLQASMQGDHPYAATGNAHAMLANRVSYLFDFNGTSQTIDTACSSALVAVSRAVSVLRAQECDYAIAGAVSLLIDPAMTRAAESMGVLSPRYRCATFDEDADGYVRAEGVGCILLKRLEDAIRDGDAIHAVIESVAENHGGRANSLTAPNPRAQQRLLLKAYTPEIARRVSYIETHGTGTKLGDPVEIDALRSAWSELVPDAPPASVAIGSVKSNIGHLEPAAGIASLFKVVLAFRHRMLPANLHFDRLNPYIHLESSPFRIVSSNTPWEEPARVAGISSFGFGGTNAHVVLSEPEPDPSPPQPSADRVPTLIVLSARTAHSLMRMKSALEAHLQSQPEGAINLRDLATTLARGREPFEYRLAWVVVDLRDLVVALGTTDGGDIRRISRTAGVEASPKAIADDPQAARDAFLSGADPADLTHAGGHGGRRIHLPGYAFDTKAYWFETVTNTVEEDV
jgi:polyketide synthase PksM